MLRTLKTILLLFFFVLTINKVVSQTKFAVIGDYGDGDNDELAVANMVKSWNVDFIITLGDNNYDNGSASTIDDNIGKYYQQFIGNYTGIYGSGATSNEFFPSLGNHDWNTTNAQPYIDYFTLPGSGFTNTSGNERYYDFVFNNIHGFSIDDATQEPDGTSEGSTQGLWLKAQRENCAANHLHWRVVCMHHPPYSTEYSSGGHGSNSYLQWNYVTWGANVVLAGHAHNYERLFIGGLTYFVNGLGGRNVKTSGTPISGSELIYGDDFGAQKVIVDGTTMKFEFHSISDGLVDTKTIIDEALPVELVSFTGKYINNNILLEWQTATEVNNYGFDVERTIDRSSWIAIDFVDGHGNSNSPKQYNFIDADINQSGTYYYKLKQIDNDGTYEYSFVVSVEVGVPDNFYLSQNYPNPFNPETRIDFALPEKQLVSLRVYNTLGELVKELVSEQREAGSYSVTFDGYNIPSGVYIYRLQTSSFASNKKMTLIK